MNGSSVVTIKYFHTDTMLTLLTATEWKLLY